MDLGRLPRIALDEQRRVDTVVVVCLVRRVPVLPAVIDSIHRHHDQPLERNVVLAQP